LYFDLPFIFVLTAVVLVFFYAKRGVTRPEGMVILGFYFVYVIIKLLQF
jgi:Ca2+/Na+ antiporter